jgi:hypothetical protein
MAMITKRDHLGWTEGRDVINYKTGDFIQRSPGSLWFARMPDGLRTPVSMHVRVLVGFVVST